MKLKHRALALILSVAMMLTFMPALAFAEAAAYPVSISYKGKPLEGYVGAWGANNLYDDGNIVTITYSDNSTKVFKYIGYDEVNDREYYNFYLNGDVNAETNYDLDIDFFADSDEIIKLGNNDGYLRYWYDEDNYVECKVTIIGKIDGDIKSVKYTQKQPITVEYEDRWEWGRNDYFVGDELVVEDSNGISTYVNKQDPFNEGSDEYDFYDASKDECADALNYVPASHCDKWEPGKTYDAAVYYKGVKASGTVKISVKGIPKPVQAEIVQTKPAYAWIGDLYQYPFNLYGEGNKIKITYDDQTVKEYTYQKYDGDYGFFCVGENGEYEEFWTEIILNNRVAEGESTVSGKMYVGWDGPGEIYLPVSVKVSASQYLVEVVEKTYQYTGKKITPKVTVKYWNGKKFKTMPKKWYTCKPKKNKKIGHYNFQIKIKKKYQKKYGSVIYGNYEIVPKKPTISKAMAGTGSITVSWKKFSKKDQKTIDGFVVQYSTNKKFTDENDETRWEWVENKKASSYKITGLENGKTYYVRVYAYTETGKGDGSMSFWSTPSKTKSATVK